MVELQNTLKRTVSSPIAKAVIMTCCVFPSLRGHFARAHVTPNHFGNRVVRVRFRNRSDGLLIAGAADVHLSFQLFWTGIDYYEPFTRTVIEMLARHTGAFIDVGANIGFFSLVAAKLNPLLRVFAFEPNPKMFALLAQHKRLNRLTNLTPEPVALSDGDGSAELFLNGSDMSASLEPHFQENFNPAVASVRVNRMTLDSYVQQHGISGSLLLKVDVEGHDQAFLAGAWRTIDRLRPDIIIEVLGAFEPAALKQFRRSGYRFYRITHQGLLETQSPTLTRIGEFVFYNYLVTTKPAGELEPISKTIRESAGHINLYRTSKFADHPV
jgi:FkbM family methyltransferase